MSFSLEEALFLQEADFFARKSKLFNQNRSHCVNLLIILRSLHLLDLRYFSISIVFGH